VYGALRRGATRLGLAAYVGAIGILVCLVALIPVVGYVTTVGVPLLAARLRGRQAARYAGLRTLAK
jgi:predicted PurR-regulated permease PerM